MEVEPADTEIDYSVIRDPIFTSVRSLEDYVNVMSIGTPEVKRIISEECDVILECKVCQSLFRSLPNFIAHKRVYCMKKFVGYLPPVPSHVTEDETVVLEPTDPDEDMDAEGKDGDKSKETSEIRPLFESVLDGSYQGTSMDYKVFTDALVKEQSLAENRDTTVVSLDNIPGNPNAKFQSVDTYQGKNLTDEELTKITKDKKRKREAAQNLENIRNKIVKVEPQPATHSHVKFALRNRKAPETDEESVAKKSPRKRPSNEEWKNHVNLKNISCKICDQKYSCLKTLRFHVENIHQEKRRFFPCPLCSALFSQVWGARRHCERHHHKSYEQWMRLADSVKQKSFLVPVDELDENGRPKNYQPSKKKKKTLSMAAKSKERAVANLKKAAEKRSAKAVVKQETDSESDSEDDSTSDDEPLSKIGASKSPSAATARSDAAGTKKLPAGFSPISGKILKVKVSPVKVDKDGREIVDGKGSTKDSPRVSIGGRVRVTPRASPRQLDTSGLTTLASGKKVYKCYNCNAVYDIKGSLNKHINRGRCFKKGGSAKANVGKVTPQDKPEEKKAEKVPEQVPEKVKTEKSGKEASTKREALASVLSPKQLRKVNALMDRENIKCLRCNKQFTALILLSRHVIRHLGIVRYKCKFCLYKSFNQGECMKHVRNSHKKNDAYKFVLNIDKDSDDTKCDTSCRGLSANNAKYTAKQNSSGVLKAIKTRSPASSSGNPTSQNAPTFDLHAAKRLFASTTAKSGDATGSGKQAPSSPPSSRPGSIARSSSVSSTGSDRSKTSGINSSNIVESSTRNYNISTRNSPRLFDTKPYKRVENMSLLTTRHGVYQKTKEGAGGERASDDAAGKSKTDEYTTIKNAGNKTATDETKTAEQVKKEKDTSTEKLIEEIFG